MKAKKLICTLLMLVMVLTMFTTYVRATDDLEQEDPQEPVVSEGENGAYEESLEYTEPIVTITTDPMYPKATFVTVTFPEGANIPETVTVTGTFPTVTVGSSTGGMTSAYSYTKGSDKTNEKVDWACYDTNKYGYFSFESSILAKSNMFVVMWGNEDNNVPLEKTTEEAEDSLVVADSCGTVSTSYFEEVKGTEASLTVVSADNAVTWKFEGEDVTDTSIVLNANAEIAKEKFSYMNNNLISEKDGVFVDFVHSGNLPGKATVTLNVGTERFGEGSKKLYLYYYNQVEDTYVFKGDASYADGKATITLTHCSSYVLIDHRIDVAGVGGSTGGVAPAAVQYVGGVLDNEPKTGEVSLVSLFILSIVSLATAVVTKK